MSSARPEVLAPAGGPAALHAAIHAGADAVYFGLSELNARARAENFTRDALPETMASLHERGVRGYVTLNTLVFDSEFATLAANLEACARAGVDAVIVQDLGAVALARQLVPELRVHASTQMTCTDAASVRFAAELGAKRVVLARELSLADVAAIRAETDVELELFVHGALCVAYSGQCLTSEAIGGRSANRGACAQACRLPYELVVDGVLRELGDVAYLLSPQDLEASALVPELLRLGVASLKIEGRLKGPEYVIATTRLYRAAVDAAVDAAERVASDGALVRTAPPAAPHQQNSSARGASLDSLRLDALQTYSRGSGSGFLGGTDHQRLVEGRHCDHRGPLAGTVTALRTPRGERDSWLELRAELPLKRGDGVLIEGGRAGDGELGGRVWELRSARTGDALSVANVGELALVWLGPERAPLPEHVGRRVFKSDDPALDRSLERAVEQEPRRLPIDVTLRGVLGAAPELIGVLPGGRTVSVPVAATLEPARGGGLESALLASKLGQLGEGPFQLGVARVETDAPAFLPPAALKQARRALVAELHRAFAPTASTSASTSTAATSLTALVEPVPSRRPPPPGLFVLCRTLPQARAALQAGADGIILDFLELTGTADAFRELSPRAPFLALAPPRIRKPGEARIDAFLRRLAPGALLVRGLGLLGELAEERRAGAEVPFTVGDFSLNVANRWTAREVLGSGLDVFTPSHDLDGTQLLALLDDGLGPFAELIVHSPLPLFHMEHCVYAALLSTGKDFRDCGRPCDRHQLSLRDRAGLEHPVEADIGCRNTVFHGSAQSALGLLPRVRERGVSRFRIELVRETEAQVGELVAAYRAVLSGQRNPREVLRELRAADGYGVVSGSLRVVGKAE